MKQTPTNCLFAVSDFEVMKIKVLNWTKQFSTFCFLDNHQYQITPTSMECMLGAGIKRSISANSGNALGQLEEFINKKKCWLFGHLGYDLKNEIENLVSAHPDHVGFPDLFFFEPEIVIRLNEQQMLIEGDNPERVFDQINNTDPTFTHINSDIHIQSRFSRKEYGDVIKKLKEHILRGDCYEINFCQEFFANDANINPFDVYQRLGVASPNPFSALYKTNDQWLICASPERFLKKEGNRILSQPIKGTSKREMEDEDLDFLQKISLQNSVKDRSENVMVVDLVRNDLSRICVEGSVKVDELYGIYSFPQVHQMISTVSGELRVDCTFSEMIRATFPMGSMTGAPKRKVMELIERYEKTKRGLFSGTVGYIDPKGDFDFNVVIRSIMYNALAKYLSFQAGSAITFHSDADNEWEECLVKTKAVRMVL